MKDVASPLTTVVVTYYLWALGALKNPSDALKEEFPRHIVEKISCCNVCYHYNFHQQKLCFSVLHSY